MESVTSRFSSSFIGKTVQSGSKVQGSAYPTLTVTSTKDKFVLNSKALALMGIGEGGYVVMIDRNRGEVATTNPNERWYLTAGWNKGKGQMEGAKIGKGGGFSYAGIYSAMQMNEPEISEASVKDMVAAGKGILRTTASDKDAFIATHKVTFKVEKLVEQGENGEPDITEFPVAEGISQKVYCLTEMDVTDHDPRSAEGEGEGSGSGQE